MKRAPNPNDSFYAPQLHYERLHKSAVKTEDMLRLLEPWESKKKTRPDAVEQLTNLQKWYLRDEKNSTELNEKKRNSIQGSLDKIDPKEILK